MAGTNDGSRPDKSPSDIVRRVAIAGTMASAVYHAVTLGAAGALLTIGTHKPVNQRTLEGVAAAASGPAEPVHFPSHRPTAKIRSDEDVVLTGSLFRARDNPEGRSAILVHGWIDNRVGTGLPERAKFLLGEGFDVLMFDLGASGSSTGCHYGMGWFEEHDVRAALTFMVERGYQPRRMAFAADSMGAAALLKASVLDGKSPGFSDVAAMVLASPYADFDEVLLHAATTQGKIPENILRPAWERTSRKAEAWWGVGRFHALHGAQLPSHRRRFLILTSPSDETVPMSQVAKVMNAFPGSEAISVDAAHEDLSRMAGTKPELLAATAGFINREIARAVA